MHKAMATIKNDHTGIGMTSERTRARMIERLRAAGITDETVLAAMAQAPRHLFIDEALASRAYDDVSLPLGFGQTISSPLVVARMAQFARAGKKLGKVLEIGTGCGYQTAVLSRLAGAVYSVERIAGLLSQARLRLRNQRIVNVKLKHADGTLGLPDAAPFDAIIVAAATREAPAALCEQLAIGGRLVFPRGSNEQLLCVIERKARGFTKTVFDAVKFVPLLPGTA